MIVPSFGWRVPTSIVRLPQAGARRGAVTTPHRRCRTFIAAIAVLALCPWSAPPAHAREDESGTGVQALQSGDAVELIRGETLLGEPGISETISKIMERDARLPREAWVLREKKERLVPFDKQQDPLALEVPSWPPPPIGAQESGAGPARRSVPRTPQTVGTSFLGIQGPGAESPFVPPDSMGDVGPSQVLVGANGRIKVFDKSGNLGALNTTMNNFFTSVGGATHGTSDPHIRYDRLSGRWFVVIITVGNCPNDLLIAVSSSSSITDTSSFTFFSFTPESAFVDYPTLGVDNNALYIGGNIFTCGLTFSGVSAYVVPKAGLLAGSPAVTIFTGLDGTPGIWTPQGVDNDDPGASEGYFIGVDFNFFGRLGILRVLDSGGTPTMSAQIGVSVPTTRMPMVQPQPAPGPGLDAVDDRLFAAAIHKNKITGALTLWTAHNIEVNSSGVADVAGNRNGSRWYEIGNLTTTPTLIQAGTLFDPSATTPSGYWMPSVMMSGQGHVALATSIASANATTGHAGISSAGRLRDDGAGTMRAATLAQSSSFLYDTFVVGTERWGDYSQTVVDPTDDQTMWTFQEYTSATNTWGVRAIQLEAPPPATPASANPPMVAPGQPSVTVVVTGTSIGGSEFFDPGPDTGGPGFANRIEASVTGGVTVSSVTFDSPTQITLGLSTVGTPTGTKSVTVTNPDGQSRTGTAILNVGGVCPTITVNPATLPVGTAGSAYSQTFTQTGGAGTILWALSGALPTGMSFESSTAVLSGTPTETGSFPIMVTATDSNGCAGTGSYALAVSRAGPFEPVAMTVDPTGNSVFEAGEVVFVEPSWQNGTGATEATTGTASGFTGPGDPDPSYTISDGTADYGSVANGATAGCAAATGDCYTLALSVPTVRPAVHWDATFRETLSGGDTKDWTLHIGDSFDDVPRANPFYPFIETLPHNSVTAGCSATSYCPTQSTLRQQMAVFTLKAKEGSGYTPPACGASPTFNDVPTSSPFCSWVEELFRRGVVAGCGGGSYCPDGPATRAQMAVFVLRTLDPALNPPACTTPLFSDVPSSDPFCPWIEELERRGVVVGCGGGAYCPDNPVTREQMGVFIGKTFELSLYGP